SASILTPHLSNATRTAAYDFIRQHWNEPPENGAGEQYWAALLKLDAARARKEIIPLYKQRTPDGGLCNLYVVWALRDVASPSKDVADAVRTWMAEPYDQPI